MSVVMWISYFLEEVMVDVIVFSQSLENRESEVCSQMMWILLSSRRTTSQLPGRELIH